MNEEVAKRIRISDICRFFETDLGKTILEKHEFVKEVPFSLLIPANEIFVGLSESDPVLVHGIIDGYVDDGRRSSCLTIRRIMRRKKTFPKSKNAMLDKLSFIQWR